jgi:hypothetical protein
MRRPHSVLVVAPLLAVACALPAAGAVKVTTGQELIYSGTLEWKQSGVGGVPNIAHRAPVKLFALVTAADPVQGYAVLVMRDIRPARLRGQANLPPFAEVFTDRYHPNMGRGDGLARPPRSVYGAPLIPLIWNRPIPFGSFPNLRIGESWQATEVLGLPGVASPWVQSKVVGETKIAGRNWVRIETTVQELPQKNERNGGSTDLTAYAGSLCVERDTGLVISDQWKASVRAAFGEQRARIDVSAAVALKEVRRLTAGEVASRIKQAAAIARVEQLAFGTEPSADRKRLVEAVKQAIAQFRRDYPAGAYAPALTPIEAYLEPEARLLALQDEPAPGFRIKDLAGKEQTLAAYRGKLILLNFFASW